MNINLKILLFIFLALFSTGAQGQFNYKAGRIITNNNDTIFGLINDGGEIRNSRFCLYKEEKRAKSIKFYPNEIKSFLLIDEKYYSAQSLNIKNKLTPCFVNVLIEGSIDLYHSRKVNDIAYYIKTEGGNLVGLSKKSIEIGQTITGSSLFWQNIIRIEFQEFKDTLPYLFRKSDLIQNQIPELKYDHKSLQNITKTYIGLTCSGSNCIAYEQDLTKSKPNYGFFTGIQFSKITFLNVQFASELKSDNAVSFPVGAFFNSPLNLFSPRLSFQVELLTSKLSYQPKFSKISNDLATVNMNSNVIAIPLFFKYGFKIKKLNPSLGFGKEIGFVFNSEFQYIRATPIPDVNDIYAGIDYLIHWQQKGAWFFDLGLAYKIHQKYYLFTSFRFQRQSNLIIDDVNSNHLTFNTVEKNNLGKKFGTDLASIRIGLGF